MGRCFFYLWWCFWLLKYLQSIFWALTFRGQKIMNQVLYDCDRYKTARCSCSMQPIINWTQWKWSRQFSGRRNLSNCKSIVPPQTAAWPAVGIKRNAGSIPRRQLQTKRLSQPVKNYAVAMIFPQYIINIIISAIYVLFLVPPCLQWPGTRAWAKLNIK